MKRPLEWCCGTLAALALLTIMLLTLVDVLGRKLLSQSVPGALEITEIMMVLLIFAALPLVSLHGEHVVFDSLDGWFGQRALRIQQIVVDAGCAVALGGLAWLMWSKAGQVAGYGDTTAQLKLPLGPFVQLMAVLCGVTCAVHGLKLFWPGIAQVDEAALPAGGAT